MAVEWKISRNCRGQGMMNPTTYALARCNEAKGIGSEGFEREDCSGELEGADGSPD